MKKILSKVGSKNIKDVVLNILAVAIFNVVIQFIVYPHFQNKVGAEIYGIILSLISFVAIAPCSVGSAANYSRVINEKKIYPSNGDYNLFLLVGSAISIVVGLVYMHILGVLNLVGGILFSLVILVSAFGYYSDVEYRYNGNFVKFFWFYIVLTAGYLVGVIGFDLTGEWAITLLIAEVFAILFAMFTTKLYKKPFKTSDKIGIVFKSSGFLVLSLLCENLTLNADRIVLLAFAGGTAVSIYYIASLFGKVIALLTTPVNAVIISYLVRSNKPLTKKMWLMFVVGGLVVCGLVLAGGTLCSYIILPLLYPDLFSLCQPYLVPAIFAQVFYFSSGVLLVVLLKYLGEKKQFLFNLCYCILFFVFAILGAYLWGLDGFVYATLLVNALRFLVVTLWGFFAIKKNGIAILDGSCKNNNKSISANEKINEIAKNENEQNADSLKSEIESENKGNFENDGVNAKNNEAILESDIKIKDDVTLKKVEHTNVEVEGDVKPENNEKNDDWKNLWQNPI